MSGDAGGGGSRSIFCLPLSTYLSSAWNPSSVARVYDENASGRAGAAGHWGMNGRP